MKIKKGINVILIIVDALNADHLGCYGYSKNSSSNIDLFAKEGVIFEQAFSQATWTVPSVASILTSLYPSVHKLDTNQCKLDESKVTLATILKRGEYLTSAFTGGGYVDRRFGFNQGFDKFKSSKYFLREREIGQGGRLQYIAQDFILWWKWNYWVRRKNKNFFAYLHCWDVHEPFIAHKKDLQLFKRDYTDILTDVNNTLRFLRSPFRKKFRCQNINSFYLNVINKGKISLNKNDISYLRALYDNEIHYLDRIFAQFINKLKKIGLFDNTLIILTADHGNELFEKWRVGHGGPMYEKLAHIPLIIRFPKAEFSGKRVNEQVQSIDIFPTILDFLNINSNQTVQGRSLIPLIQGRSDNLPAYAEDIGTRSIRWDKWKLITRKPESYSNASIELTVDSITGNPVLMVKCLELNDRVGINFLGFQKYKKSLVMLSARVRALQGEVEIELGIRGTDSRIKTVINQDWRWIIAPSFIIPERMPDNQFWCELLSRQQGASWLVSQWKLEIRQPKRLLFDYSFDNLFCPSELYNIQDDPSEQNNLLFENE